MKKSLRDVLVGQLSGYGRAVEVGIGRESSVAAALIAHEVDMVTVDVHDFPTSDGTSFVRDDALARTDTADFGPYAVVEVIYVLNIPIELHRPAVEVARRADADFLFTTLGYDEPSVPVSREPLPGETLYVAERGRWDRRAQRDSSGRSQE